MTAQSNLKFTLLLSSYSLLFLSSSAHAAGFALIENSASGMGKAYAGSAAVAEDASTAWFNPAGMNYLTDNLGGKSQLSNSLNLVVAQTKYKDKGSTPPSSLGSATINGKKNGKETNCENNSKEKTGRKTRPGKTDR